MVGDGLLAVKVHTPGAERQAAFVFHVLVDDRPACNAHARGRGLEVDLESIRLAAEASPRCQRGGCRVRWPA